MTTHHRIITTAVMAVSLCAGAAPAAARFDLNGTPAAQATTAPRTQVVRVSAARGFDWGDAGIGAAGGVALSLLAVGGTLAVSERRQRRSSGSTAAAN